MGHLIVDMGRLAEMWRAGAPTAEIAAELGCGVATVRSRAARAGLGGRPHGGTIVIDRARLDTMLADGMSNVQIARVFGVTRQAVSRAAKELRAPTAEAVEREAPPEVPAPVATPPNPAPNPIQHPFWTPARDAALARSKGSHAELAELAAAFGKPMTFVRQRWHRLRGAA